MLLEFFEETSFFESSLAAVGMEIYDATLFSTVAAFIELKDGAWHVILLQDASECETAWAGSDDGDPWRHCYALC